MIFKDRLQATFLCHLQVRNEIKKKRKILDFYGLTIVCVKFNKWKLTTSLFLFFMRIVQLYVDKIFVQRTVLGVILKTI